MLWTALLLDTTTPSRTLSRIDEVGDAVKSAATCCLQFTPRVTIVETANVLMETEASMRLFGGKHRLVERVRDKTKELGVERLGWAPTSFAALALAWSGVSNGFAKLLEQLLNALPLESLTAVVEQRPTLERLGCRTLGHVRALPRGRAPAPVQHAEVTGSAC